jgi:hypothetical protein
MSFDQKAFDRQTFDRQFASTFGQNLSFCHQISGCVKSVVSANDQSTKWGGNLLAKRLSAK